MSAITFPPSVPKLLRLLGTDNDAECVAAARALGRALRSHGQTFHSLAVLVEHRRGDGRHHPRGGDGVLDRADWRALVEWCRAYEYRLTDWEAEFLSGLSVWVGTPTQRQLHRLDAIAAKLRGAR
jgi:hypothetical protein